MTTQNKITRRSMLQGTAAIGTTLWLGGESQSRADDSPNEKINIACIGIGGRGGANVGGCSGQNIVALCDVDERRGARSFTKFPKAKRFVDFRRMLTEMENQIDAVVVSTPDHTHFHPSMMAMGMGKHLYCEKPMAHSVWEIREMTKKAKEMKVATQLGVQRHTLTNMHRSVELIKAGAIGKVSEVHCWVGGDRGMPKIPTDKPEVPKTLNWDLWVGPAKDLGYHPSICPYGWRFWWDYGTGETGNWGCHILDIPFWALDLKYPDTVEGSGPEQHELTTPKQMATKMTFKDQGVDLHWYHSKSGPAILKEKGISGKGINTVFVGSEGILATGFGSRKLYPEEKFSDYKAPSQTIKKSPGFYNEWFTAIRGGEAATCDFAYSGPLSETVLLGNIGYRAGEKFGWNADSLEVSGSNKAASMIRNEYRPGWEV